MMLFYIFFIAVILIMIFFSYKWGRLISDIKRTTLVFSSIAIDKSVDEICDKAVVIAEYKSHDEKRTEEQRQAKAFETACGIVADVLLQHGLNTRDYNIEGLVTLAQHRQGIIALSQYTQEEKKCQKQEDHLVH